MDGEDPPNNFEIIEENVNKLSKTVQDTNPPIFFFLSDPYCLPAFHESPIGIKEYTNNHLLELLSIGLSPDLDIKTIRAFYHFCFNDNPLSFKPILENRFFSNVSEVIIQNCINNLQNHIKNSNYNQKYYLDDMSNAVLGRISTVAFNSFYNCPKESMESIKFLPDLLYFCYNPSVCSLFEKLLTGNTRFLGIQNWLVNDLQICLKIVEVIEYFTSNKGININDENDYSLNVASMYKLISYGLVSSNMGNYFRSDQCISVITGMLNSNDNQRIRDARWYSTTCLCNPVISSKLLPVVEIAMKNLTTPTNRLTIEIVQCISFISLMLKYSPFQTAKIISSPSSQIFSIIMGIVLQFSSSTALHFTFRSFVMNCIKNKLLMPEVINAYVPFFMAEIHNRKNYLDQLESHEKKESVHINCSVEFIKYDEIIQTKNNSMVDSSRNNNNISLKATDDYSSHPKFKESSHNGLFYATCWSLLIKIYAISSSSSKSFNKIRRLSSSISSNEDSPQPKKKSIFSYFSSKRQKNQDQQDNDIDASSNNNLNDPNPNDNSTEVNPIDIQNELVKIADFDLFVKDELKSYLKLLEGSYGGPLPILPTDQQQANYSKL